TIDIGIDEFTGAVVQDADMAVTIIDDPDPVTFGGNITYTATVTNNGPGEATSVQLAGGHGNTLFISATPSQGPACAAGFGVYQCQLGTIANGASAIVTIVVETVNPVMVPTPVSFSADVTANETDPNMADNNAVEQTTVVPPGPAMADLAITKVDTPDPVSSGGPQLTWDITVTNNGPDGATGVTMTDTLPAGVVYNAATSTAGTCSELNSIVTCNIGDLALNATATVMITVIPDLVAVPTDITNNASVTAAEIDPVAGNNAVAETTTVNPPSSDMMIAMSVSPTSPLINEQITFDFTVSNDGPSDNTNVLLTLTLPVNGTVQSITVDQGSCGTPNGTVDCTIGDMPFGATVSGQVVVTAPGQPATLTLLAAVSGDVADPTPANNSASDAVSVIDVIDVTIQGKSKGTGSLGWFELLLMLMVASFVGLRATLHRTPIRSVATLFALVGAVSLLVCTPTDNARAEGEWYVGASVGASDADYSASALQSDLANLGWSINNASVDDTDTAWKAYAGFSFNEYIAVEGGFVDLGEVQTEFGATIAPTQIDAILRDTYSIHPVLGDGWFGSVVVSWPVSPDRFSLTARAGLFGWESDIDVRVISGGTGSVSDRDSGTDMLYGVGVEWHLNEQWSMTADWERYELTDWVDVPSIGVKIRF
ncbi:MAG: outer membrane beta-barrel protein, partial [Gammaproteobacteria bacterium]|nr:outer membrane beta-barrel protein [Gammaproteobacteria bacterium]